MENKLKKSIREKGSSVGTFLNAATPQIVEILSHTGLDHVIIDTEHGTYDLADVSDMVRAADSKGLCAVVRVSEPTHREIQHALDCGADVIIVPLLRKIEDFKKAAEFGKFPPLGNRGYANGRGNCYGYEKWASGTAEEFMRNANEKTLLIPQCETLEALEQIEEIVRIDGIDGIFVGPLDLSLCMGIPTQFDKPEFQAAVKRILKACKDAGKISMIFTGNADQAKKYLEMGFDAVSNGLDANLICQVYRDMVESVRGA